MYSLANKGRRNTSNLANDLASISVRLFADVPTTPPPSVPTPSTILVAQNFICVGAAVANELENTSTPVEAIGERHVDMVDNLREKDVFESFVRVAASLYPRSITDQPYNPEPEITASDVIHAGCSYEDEKYRHGCFGVFPNYTPHPAFDCFEAIAIDPLAWDPQLTRVINETLSSVDNSHPWDGDLDVCRYRAFMATWHELRWRRIEQQSHQHQQHNTDNSNGSISSYTDVDDGRHTSCSLPSMISDLRSLSPPLPDLVFTARELLDTGIALDAATQANNGDAASLESTSLLRGMTSWLCGTSSVALVTISNLSTLN
jgi:hypothetical protein